jgi:CDP-diacylglycerol--glycerol-3-phosphate 3-phosphatidyltransferase
MSGVRILNKHFVNGFFFIVDPIGDMLEAIHVHPHVVTVTGLLFSFVSGALFWTGHFISGGIMIILSGVCDVLDGRLARKTARMSPFGALLDSTIDRYSEIAIYLGLMAYFNSIYISSLIILAIAGSLMTSYVRARAEGLDIECKVGLMQRPERIVFLATAAILGPIADRIVGAKIDPIGIVIFDRIFESGHILMKIAILAIALLANVTVIQRMLHVSKKLKLQ